MTSDNTPGPTEWTIGEPHGLGPWATEHPGEPEPVGEQFDPVLLAEGDRRNVVDAYRYWNRAAIVADLDTRRHPFEVAIENFAHDHNIGTVVRTANAFLARRVHIIGKKRWNRRGAMVTDRYQHVHHHPEHGDLLTYAREHHLSIVAVDNTDNAERIELAQLPERALFVFGTEADGLTPEAQDAADMHVSIAQFGSTRSINAGVAAGIVMHCWIRQHADLNAAW